MAKRIKTVNKEMLKKTLRSGGCHANADLVNGTIEKPYEYGCKIQRKRLEMAIIVQALLTEDVREGKKDERPVIDNFKYQVDE